MAAAVVALSSVAAAVLDVGAAQVLTWPREQGPALRLPDNQPKRMIFNGHSLRSVAVPSARTLPNANHF